MEIEEISKKIKDVKTFAEVKEILTPEELICYEMKYGHWSNELAEGDECLVIEIVKILGEKGYSIRHCLFLLDVAKDTLISIARINI